MGVLEKMRRVLLVSSKPDKEEFSQSFKVTGIGFIIIGVVGFAIFLIAQAIIGAGIPI